MANYFYVYAGGTASGATADASGTNGIATAPLTGAWSVTASEYFADVMTALAATVSPVSGDRIVVRSGHSKTYTANTDYNLPDGVSIWVVSATDREAYDPGTATEQTTGLYDMYPICDVLAIAHIFGLNINAGDDVFIGNATNGTTYFHDLTLALLGVNSADRIIFNADGAVAIFDNVDFTFGNVGQRIRWSSGSRFEVQGGSVTTNQTTLIENNGAGGSNADINSWDLSAITTGNIVEVNPITDDTIDATFTRCKINSGATRVSGGGPFYPGQTVDFSSCGGADEYYDFEHYQYTGVVIDNTSVYRTNGSMHTPAASYTAANAISAEFVTNSKVAHSTDYLTLETKGLQVDLTSGVVLTYYIMQMGTAPATLTDKDFIVEVEHPDATSEAWGKVVRSSSKDIFDIGANLTTSTETWNGTSGIVVQQKVSVTLPTVANANANCKATFKLAYDVTTAGDTFYLCLKPDIV